MGGGFGDRVPRGAVRQPPSTCWPPSTSGEARGVQLVPFFFSFSDWRASVLLPVSVVTQERLQKEACDKGLHPGPAVSRCSCPLGGNASLYLEGSPGPFLWGQRAQGRTGSAPAPWSRGSIGPGSGGTPPRSAGTWAAPVLVRSSQGSTQPPDWGTGLGARQPSSGDCCSH